MDDLISRQAAIMALAFSDDTGDMTCGQMAKVLDVIKAVPTIDPVKHGEWVYKGARGRFPICECSVCGNAENADWAILGDNVNYCPNCGAKMDGGKDDQEG